MTNGKEVKEVNFADLKRGDKLIVENLLGKNTERNEITITGIRKDGLRVIVKEECGNDKEEYTARMPGGFTKFTVGITPGIMKVRNEKEENCLYFENLKDIKTGERLSASHRSTPIEKIILIKSQQKP